MTELANYEAEQAVIGGILQQPESVSEVADWLRPDMFSDAKTRSVYTAITRLWVDRKPAGYLTITEELKAMGAKSEANVALFLQECAQAEPFAIAYVSHHAEIVRKMAERRAIEAAGAEMVRIAHTDLEVNTDDLIIGARRKIESFQRTRTTPQSQAEQINELRELSKRIWSGEYVDRVVPTGIRELDRMTGGGFRPGELIVWGAKQSMGKTATGLHIAKRAPWVFFSLEMSKTAINRRLVATEAGVPYEVAMAPVCDQELRDRWEDASYYVETWPLTIVAEQGMTTMRIEAMIERFREEREVCGIMIDHIGYIADQVQGANEYERASEKARRVKHLAGRLDLPVVALQQLTKEVERRSTCMPTMNDLRDTGKLAEDADMVALLFRRNYYVAKGILDADLEKDYVKSGDRWDLERLQIKLDKNRNGETGIIDLGWEGKTMRVHEVAA